MSRTDPTLGQVVKVYRSESGWTQKQLADQLHLSVSWVAQVERDERIPDVHLLGRLATIFGISRDELIDAAYGPEAERIRDRPYVEQLRKALSGHPAPDHIARVNDLAEVDFGALQQRVDTVWDQLHSSSYQQLGPELARLVAELETAARSCPADHQYPVLELLAKTYQAASAMLVKVGDRGAGWVAADRAIIAGERCDNRGLILAGQLRMARTLLDSEEQALAGHVLNQVVARTDGIVSGGNLGEISLAGSCALLLAILNARDARTEDAETVLNVARRLAAKIGEDRNLHNTEFGPTNVAMHAVAVAVELGNGQQALDRTKHVRDTAHMSGERQARYLIDVARAHVLTRNLDRAIGTLLAAEKIAPQELAESPRVSTILDDIEALARPKPRALRELRRRLQP